jgi:hypothetical protein
MATYFSVMMSCLLSRVFIASGLRRRLATSASARSCLFLDVLPGKDQQGYHQKLDFPVWVPGSVLYWQRTNETCDANTS